MSLSMTSPLRLVGLLWILVFVGCSSGKDRPVQEVGAVLGDDGIQRIEITAHSYWFEPNRVIVKSGLTVELTVKNGSLVVPHNFTCTAPKAGIEIDLGLGMLKDTEVAVFTPSQPGEYSFFCSKGSHAKKGMTGTLVVVAD